MVDGGEDGLPFVLLGQVAMGRAIRSEGGGENEATNVGVPLVGGHPVP